MAEFEAKCPHCGAELKMQDEWVGLEAECPNCKQHFTIAPPSESQSSAADAAEQEAAESRPSAEPPSSKLSEFKSFFGSPSPGGKQSEKSESKFLFTCPNCGRKIKALESWRGRMVECPHCQKAVMIEDRHEVSGNNSPRKASPPPPPPNTPPVFEPLSGHVKNEEADDLPIPYSTSLNTGRETNAATRQFSKGVISLLFLHLFPIDLIYRAILYVITGSERIVIYETAARVFICFYFLLEIILLIILWKALKAREKGDTFRKFLGCGVFFLLCVLACRILFWVMPLEWYIGLLSRLSFFSHSALTFTIFLILIKVTAKSHSFTLVGVIILIFGLLSHMSGFFAGLWSRFFATNVGLIIISDTCLLIFLIFWLITCQISSAGSIRDRVRKYFSGEVKMGIAGRIIGTLLDWGFILLDNIPLVNLGTGAITVITSDIRKARRRRLAPYYDEVRAADVDYLQRLNVLPRFGKDLSQLVSQATTLFAPAFDGVPELVDYVAIVDEDMDFYRYNLEAVTKIYTFEDQLFIYEGVWDYTLGRMLSEKTEAFFFKDITDVTTQSNYKIATKDEPKGCLSIIIPWLGREKKTVYKESESFTLTSSSGNSISLTLGFDEAIAASGATYTRRSDNEKIVHSIRKMVEEKKAAIHE